MASLGMLARRAAMMAMASAVILGASQGGVQADSRARGDLFDRLAGSWSGVGTAAVEGGNPERIRCRADFQPSSSVSLRLALRCASDSFNLQIESAVSRDGDRLVGTWTETSVGVSGHLAGMAFADRLRATIDGMGLSGDLSLIVRGDTQSITLSSQGQFSANASMTLRRA